MVKNCRLLIITSSISCLASRILLWANICWSRVRLWRSRCSTSCTRSATRQVGNSWLDRMNSLFLVTNTQLYKRLCPSVRWFVVIESNSGETSVTVTFHACLCVWWGLVVGCPRPPVRNDIVTPCHSLEIQCTRVFTRNWVRPSPVRSLSLFLCRSFARSHSRALSVCLPACLTACLGHSLTRATRIASQDYPASIGCPKKKHVPSSVDLLSKKVQSKHERYGS